VENPIIELKNINFTDYNSNYVIGIDDQSDEPSNNWGYKVKIYNCDNVSFACEQNTIVDSCINNSSIIRYGSGYLNKNKLINGTVNFNNCLFKKGKERDVAMFQKDTPPIKLN